MVLDMPWLNTTGAGLGRGVKADSMTVGHDDPQAVRDLVCLLAVCSGCSMTPSTAQLRELWHLRSQGDCLDTSLRAQQGAALKES